MEHQNIVLIADHFMSIFNFICGVILNQKQKLGMYIYIPVYIKIKTIFSNQTFINKRYKINKTQGSNAHLWKNSSFIWLSLKI